MSGLPVTAERDVASAMLAALRTDPGVIAAFGSPPRIFDDETRRAPYPFAILERHESEPAGASLSEGQVHRLTFTTASRAGGRLAAKTLIGALRRAAEGADLSLTGQRVVLIQAVYADVVRTSDRASFRGLLRIRIITEEAA
ncbi:MAG: DUF3168 domain-containing protein [Hyphomonadaceae bacterium]|nr:DUF3168 domain-containing protein [Hyphomonadaceae bacterium]